METAKNLHQKLVSIQAEISVPKSKYNEFGKFNYRDADDILKAVTPFLKKHEVSITTDDEIIMVGQRIYVKSTATLSDGKDSISKSAFAREPELKKGMDESQITGTSSSYAKKSALGGLLGLNGQADSDSSDTTEEPATKPGPKKSKGTGQINETIIPFGSNKGKMFKDVTAAELLTLCKKIIDVNDEEKTEVPKEEQEFMKTVKLYVSGGKK